MNRATKLLKEPLLHFLVAGGALFAAYGWFNSDSSDAGARQVRFGDGEVQWLKETWARQWQREPSREELRGLVTEFLKEELLAREARELGLDDNDIVVRRRLAQKMTFLVQDTSRLAEPTEDELQHFYETHPKWFQSDARVSFIHLFFSRERRADAAADAQSALARLSHVATADPARMGDRLLIESEFRDADEQTVAGQFGSEFSRAVFALAPGAWHGPIESGFGLHLVRVSDTTPARQRDFAQVKAHVLERWREQKTQEDDEQYFAMLLKKYDIVADDNVKDLIDSLASQRMAAR